MLSTFKKDYCFKFFRTWLDLRKLEDFIIDALIFCSVLLALVVSELILT